MDSFKKKKVLFLARFFAPPLGGGEFFIISVLKYLKEKGYSCMGVCYYDPETNAQFKTEKLTEWQGIPVLQTSIDRISKIQELYEDIEPDLVITQSYDAPIIVDVAKRMGIKTILGTHFWRNICAVNDNFVGMLDRPMDTVTLLKTYHRVFHEADEMYVNSKFMQKAVERYVGVNIERIIHPLVDVTRVLCSEKTDDYITIVNPDSGKGGDVFADIARKMPERKFMSVGLASEIIPENIKINSKIKRLSNIKILEKTDNMKDIYAQTKILLIPSLVDETFSMVALEAMANGIPILSSSNGNLPFLVENGGFLLDTGDIDSWVDAIKELFSDTLSYNNISENAKNNSHKYDSNIELNKFHEMVKLCIGESE